MGIFSLIISLLGCIVGFFLLKTALKMDAYEGFKKVRSIITSATTVCVCLLILGMSVDAILHRHELLYHAPKPEYIHATVSIDEAATEDTSVLYVFRDDLHYQMTPDEVNALFGAPQKDDRTSASHILTYTTAAYTLNGVAADQIIVLFDEYDRIRSVKWSCETPDEELYFALLDHLTAILGEPERQDYSPEGSWTATWPGFYLECNSYRVAFARQFRS